MKKKIKFIYGLPYRLPSQGAVERLQRIIKNGLLNFKFKMKRKFNIDYALN